MKIALIGNQNSGKTSLYNLLASKKEITGNRAGVTVGAATAKVRIGKDDIGEITDLPGTYSLTAYSPEERITTDFFERNEDALYVNVLDGTNLERGLYLTLQICETKRSAIIVVSMADVLSKRGVTIDKTALEKALKRKVVFVSVKKKTGINELIAACSENYHPKEKPAYATKSFDGSSEEKKAEKRYYEIERILKTCLKKPQRQKTVTERIDKVLLNGYLAIPVFVAVMAATFALSVGSVGSALSEALNTALKGLDRSLRCFFTAKNVPATLTSLIFDGIMTGAGTVLTFLPRLMILFAITSFMEGCGYTARVAFTFDALLKKIDLDGRAIIPLILGYGCSVPAVLSTKSIKDDRTKNLSTLLVPFVPCSAKLPMIALFADFFFVGTGWALAALIYFSSIVFIIVAAKIYGAFLEKKDFKGYFFELPEYKLPSFRSIASDVFDKSFSFLRRTGTIIILSSVVIWALSYFTLSFSIANGVCDSALYSIGKTFSFILRPVLGTMSPPAAFATLAGLIAKEQVVSTMAVISGTEGAAGIFLSEAFSFSRPTALSFLYFNVFCMPCYSAIATIKEQLNDKKTFAFFLFYQNSFAYVVSAIVGLIARAAGL